MLPVQVSSSDVTGSGGGAVFYQLQRCTASSNVFRRNVASAVGGGIWILGLNSTTAHISDSR